MISFSKHINKDKERVLFWEFNKGISGDDLQQLRGQLILFDKRLENNSAYFQMLDAMEFQLTHRKVSRTYIYTAKNETE